MADIGGLINAASIAAKMLTVAAPLFLPVDTASSSVHLNQVRPVPPMTTREAPVAILDQPVQPKEEPGAGTGNSPLASRIVAAEGPPVASSTSTAAGHGQFLRDTWLEMFRRAYPRPAQILTGDQILALREVKPLAEALTERYAGENAAALRRFGLTADDGALSLAHAIGPGGAHNVLAADPGRSVHDLLSPQAIAANPGFAVMNAGQLRRWAAARIGVVNPAAAAEVANAPISNVPATLPEPAIIAIGPKEDFLVDRRTSAAQILTADKTAIERLRLFLQAANAIGSASPLNEDTRIWLASNGINLAELKRGSAGARHSLEKAGTELMLVMIRTLAPRPRYAGFTRFVRPGSASELKNDVIRHVCEALVAELIRETKTIAAIIEHRRSRAQRPALTDAFR